MGGKAVVEERRRKQLKKFSKPNDSAGKVDSYLARLTRRELEIAGLIGDGECNKGIASRLNISERTVKAHLHAIFQKLQLSTRLNLCVLVFKQKIRA